MFASSQNRYITRGVSAEIPPETQLLLWALIDELGKARKLDYLQVFNLETEDKDGVTYQAVTHSQEQPPFKERHLYTLPEAVKAKVFCIDDETHSTMLLVEEY